NLSYKLQLPATSDNPDQQVAKRLSELDRPVAVVSGIYARQWDEDEPKRVAAWLHWWDALARGTIRLSVIPILRIVMEKAKPGWQKRGYPSERHATAKFDNKEICRHIERLRSGVGGNALTQWFGGGRSGKVHLSLSVPPILNPIEKPHADDWLE